MEDWTNKVIQGDCLEVMKGIPDKSIDMILCDLPYGTTACKWDVIIPFDKLWEQYHRIIKDNGAIVLTASQPFTSALVMSNVKNFKYCWTWDKITAKGHLTAKIRPMQQTEDVCIFSKNKINYNPHKDWYRDCPSWLRRYAIQTETSWLSPRGATSISVKHYK